MTRRGAGRPRGAARRSSRQTVIEIIGTSELSWEDAAKKAVERAGAHLDDLRVAEIVELDMRLEKNKVTAYRAKVKVSFKYHEDA